jgi:hypothetical protein
MQAVNLPSPSGEGPGVGALPTLQIDGARPANRQPRANPRHLTRTMAPTPTPTPEGEGGFVFTLIKCAFR